jgi:hypothetical protein
MLLQQCAEARLYYIYIYIYIHTHIHYKSTGTRGRTFLVYVLVHMYFMDSVCVCTCIHMHTHTHAPRARHTCVHAMHTKKKENNDTKLHEKNKKYRFRLRTWPKTVRERQKKTLHIAKLFFHVHTLVWYRQMYALPTRTFMHTYVYVYIHIHTCADTYRGMYIIKKKRKSNLTSL